MTALRQKNNQPIAGAGEFSWVKRWGLGIWGGSALTPALSRRERECVRGGVGPLPLGEGWVRVGQPDSLSTENVAVQARPIAVSRVPMARFNIVTALDRPSICASAFAVVLPALFPLGVSVAASGTEARIDHDFCDLVGQCSLIHPD